MKTARLKALELELPLGRLQEYHDEGFVKDLQEKLSELSEQYNDHIWLMQLELLEFTGGKIPRAGAFSFYTGWPFKTRHVHILYENQESDMLNINCRAHEEAEALVLFGTNNIRLLEKAIASNGFSLISPLSQSNHETIAKISGLYALLQRGYSKEDIQRNLPGYLTRELALIERK